MRKKYQLVNGGFVFTGPEDENVESLMPCTCKEDCGNSILTTKDGRRYGVVGWQILTDFQQGGVAKSPND